MANRYAASLEGSSCERPYPLGRRDDQFAGRLLPGEEVLAYVTDRGVAYVLLHGGMSVRYTMSTLERETLAGVQEAASLDYLALLVLREELARRGARI